jgi:hypothetical protein
MNVITSTLLNRFWQNGIVPIENSIGAIQLVGIQLANTSTSVALANGTSAALTYNFAAMSGATDYIIIPQASSWGNVSGVSRTGTTLTINVLNISGGSHTIIVYFYIIGYKQV